MELWELYRAGSRHKPTQGFELTQGFERTRGGSKIQKNGRFALGFKICPGGQKFALGVKICPGVAVQFPVGFVETNRDELGRIAGTKKQVSLNKSDQNSIGRLTGRSLVEFSPNQTSIGRLIGRSLVDNSTNQKSIGR